MQGRCGATAVANVVRNDAALLLPAHPSSLRLVLQSCAAPDRRHAEIGLAGSNI